MKSSDRSPEKVGDFPPSSIGVVQSYEAWYIGALDEVALTGGWQTREFVGEGLLTQCRSNHTGG